MFSFFSNAKTYIEQSGQVKAVVYGAMEAVIEYPICIGAIHLENKLYRFFGKEKKRREVFFEQIDYLPLLCLITSGAIIEELLFRGALMPVIEKGLSSVGVKSTSAKITSEICTALLFSVMHHPGSRITTLISGIAYGKLSNSFGLICAISAHVTHNALAATHNCLENIKKTLIDKEQTSNFLNKKLS